MLSDMCGVVVEVDHISTELTGHLNDRYTSTLAIRSAAAGRRPLSCSSMCRWKSWKDTRFPHLSHGTTEIIRASGGKA